MKRGRFNILIPEVGETVQEQEDEVTVLECPINFKEAKIMINYKNKTSSGLIFGQNEE